MATAAAAPHEGGAFSAELSTPRVMPVSLALARTGRQIIARRRGLDVDDCHPSEQQRHELLMGATDDIVAPRGSRAERRRQRTGVYSTPAPPRADKHLPEPKARREGEAVVAAFPLRLESDIKILETDDPKLAAELRNLEPRPMLPQLEPEPKPKKKGRAYKAVQPWRRSRPPNARREGAGGAEGAQQRAPAVRSGRARQPPRIVTERELQETAEQRRQQQQGREEEKRLFHRSGALPGQPHLLDQIARPFAEQPAATAAAASSPQPHGSAAAVDQKVEANTQRARAAAQAARRQAADISAQRRRRLRRGAGNSQKHRGRDVDVEERAARLMGVGVDATLTPRQKVLVGGGGGGGARSWPGQATGSQAPHPPGATAKVGGAGPTAQVVTASGRPQQRQSQSARVFVPALYTSKVQVCFRCGRAGHSAAECEHTARGGGRVSAAVSLHVCGMF
eukprot:COSAG01_NODE_334_length_18708_cov_49.649686_17_plen_452_part_00